MTAGHCHTANLHSILFYEECVMEPVCCTDVESSGYCPHASQVSSKAMIAADIDVVAMDIKQGEVEERGHNFELFHVGLASALGNALCAALQMCTLRRATWTHAMLT